MKKRRNLTRFKSYKMFVLFKHSLNYWRKKIKTRKTINNEFD